MWARAVGPVLLALGVGLVLAAVATGAAHLALVVIVPVVYGGASPLFLGGVAAIALGILALGLTFGEPLEAPGGSEPGPARPQESPRSAGGLVLIGPIPIFFGSWKGASRRAVVLAAAAGALALLGLIVLALWLR